MLVSGWLVDSVNVYLVHIHLGISIRDREVNMTFFPASSELLSIHFEGKLNIFVNATSWV